MYYDREELVKFYTGILDRLCNAEEDSFRIFLDNRQEDYLCDLDFELLRHNEVAKKERIYYYNGASKGVIQAMARPEYVIKFNLSCSPSDLDYCQREFEIYRKAEEEGLDQYFAAIDFLFTYGEDFLAAPLDIYLMEAIEPDQSHFYSTGKALAQSNPNLEEEEKNTSYARDEDLLFDAYGIEEGGDELFVKAYLIEFWGRPTQEKVYHFLYRNEVNDLHTGNVGEREDGSTVFFDYSGYY